VIVNGETVGQALRRWREHRHLSLRQLGKLVNYSHVYLWEIEKGTKPTTAEIAAACDDQLHAGGQLIALATQLVPTTPVVTDETIGLDYPADFSEGIEAVTTLWNHDASRRRFLHHASYLSSALALPIQHWLNHNDTRTELTNASEPPSAETIRATTAMFRKLDNLYGGGQIRPTVVRYLDAEVSPQLRGTTPEQLGRPLLSAIAELTQLAGWLAYDSCAHGIAQRYLLQSLRLAGAAQDRALGAEILAALSHQAIFLRETQSAIDLAEAAHRTAARAQVPALVAEAPLLAAHAHAQNGDEPQATVAITAAESVFEHADRANGPQWLDYFDEAYLAAITGHCFRALGKPIQAKRAARRFLEMTDGYQRGRLFNQLLLAGSHVLARDVDQACTVGHQALDLAERMSSARAVTYLDRLVRDLKPWRADARVKELAEHARLVTAQV
jgi:transcriptional regulator with XRE-family HTH domain